VTNVADPGVGVVVSSRSASFSDSNPRRKKRKPQISRQRAAIARNTRARGRCFSSWSMRAIHPARERWCSSSSAKVLHIASVSGYGLPTGAVRGYPTRRHAADGNGSQWIQKGYCFSSEQVMIMRAQRIAAELRRTDRSGKRLS
jgi:hypothetical protein